MIKEAYKLGVLAFMPKDAEPGFLINVIKKAHAGKKYFLPDIAQKLAYVFSERDNNPENLLNDRELEVDTLIACDRSNTEFEVELGLSQKTVNNIFFALRSKTGVSQKY